jgi:DNA-binding LacI/PurR family transcriptional regulator
VDDPNKLLDTLIVDERRSTPLHMQVRRGLRSVIDEHFADGDQFYTESVLVERLRVSRGTVRQALNELTREGVIVRRVRTGTTVCKQPDGSDSIRRKSELPQTVGVFVAQYDSEYLSAMLEKLAGVCSTRGMRLKVYHTHCGQKLADSYREVVLPPEQERFILVTPDSTSQLNEALRDRGHRTVAMELPDKGYSGAVVETDSTMAVHMGIDYLWSLGHRRITLLVNEPIKAPSVAEKVEAFRRIALARGVDETFKTVICGTEFWQSSYEAAMAHMADVWGGDNAQRPTAVFAVSDPGAWAALQWFARRGISVPGEVSVLGFEGARTSQFTHPSLSTVAHDIDALTTAAVEMLWSDTESSKRLSPSLIIRESTGPAPMAE